MPLLHNRAYKVLQQIIKIENDLKELHQTVQESIRCSDRRAIFCANAYVEYHLECVKDQIPEKFNGFAQNCGHVVAVDYRREKDTIDCGNMTDCGTGEIIYHIFELDITDVYVPKDYESKGDFPNREFEDNSNKHHYVL